MNPAPPSRKTQSITLGFGLVSIPVGLYAGTESAGIQRKEFSPDGKKVGRQPIIKDTGDPIAYDQIVRHFELPDGRTVELSNEEIEQVVQPVRGVGEIVAFLKLTKLDSYVADALYQVRPGKTAGDAGARKAYKLLLESMKAEKVFGLVQFVMSGVPKYGALLPNGRLRILKFEEEIRQDAEMPDATVSDAELEMGRALIKAATVTTPPALVDESTAKIVAYAEAKATGEVPKAEPAPQADVVPDLMAALEASVASVKKARAS